MEIASDTEQQVSDCLHRLGIPHERSFLCAKSERTIDIAVELGGLRLALEVDGPTHFLKEPEHTLNGFTRFRNRMLAAHGWTVLSVPYFFWDFRTPEQQDEYLHKVLSEYLSN